MRADLELERLAGGDPDDPPPVEWKSDRIRFPAARPADLQLARALLEGWLGRGELPGWFTERCLPDEDVKTCEIKRWSLRAWRYWQDPENRRWWWWGARAHPEGGVEVTVLVRDKPYLKGSLEWIFTVAREAAG